MQDLYIMVCGPVAREQMWNKQLYNGSYGQWSVKSNRGTVFFVWSMPRYKQSK